MITAPPLSIAPSLYHLVARLHSSIHAMVISCGSFVGAIIAVYGSLQFLLYYTQDKREPLPLALLIPFVSPIIGMSPKKKPPPKSYVTFRYTKSLMKLAAKENDNDKNCRDKYKLSICTLPIP